MARRTRRLSEQETFFKDFVQLLVDTGVIFPEWRWSLSQRRRIFKFYRDWFNG